MSGHNNPIDLALWESRHINPASAKPDLVVSLGTGLQKETASYIMPRYRNIFMDGFIVRIYRTFRKVVLGSEATWKKLMNSLDEATRKRCFRLNVPLSGSMAVDNVDRLPEMRDIVHQSNIVRECEQVAYALAISSFYFELATVRFVRGRYHCLGAIRSRLSGPAMTALLERTQPSDLVFVTAARTLGPIHWAHDVCADCHRFHKRVEFSVQDQAEQVSITAQSSKGVGKAISAFPQSMLWFRTQQNLDAVFGTADHADVGRSSCAGCDPRTMPQRSPLFKRERCHDEQARPAKRRRQQEITDEQLVLPA